MLKFKIYFASIIIVKLYKIFSYMSICLTTGIAKFNIERRYLFSRKIVSPEDRWCTSIFRLYENTTLKWELNHTYLCIDCAVIFPNLCTDMQFISHYVIQFIPK